MTAPLVPSDVDLRDFQFMPLDVARLIDSDLAAISTGDEFKAAVTLWCKSWHQVPASSLPSDDRMLAHLAGYGKDIKGWKKVRDVALRGFVACNDGRLYHPVIAEKAVEAAAAKVARAAVKGGVQTRKQRERAERAALFTQLRNAGVVAKWDVPTRDLREMVADLSRDEGVTGHAPVTPPVTPKPEPVTPPVTPPVTAMTGTGTGTGIDIGRVESSRARDPDADLERKLREAAGWQNETAPMLAVTGEIQALIDAGADLNLDVLPVVTAIAPKARGRSWRFFVTAIAEARDRRIAAATVISLPAERTASHGQPARRHSPSQQLADAFDRVKAHIAERDQVP